MNTAYATNEPVRAEVDKLEGPVVIEFGTDWCSFCQAAQPLISTAFADHPQVRYFKIEDGSGRRLGRSFGIKLWPTLVFLRGGKEMARLIRPRDVAAISAALASIVVADS